MITNPYPGLRPFEYNENHLFFGREGQSQEIAGRLENNRFVAVVGTSGSGKSSLVKAGLIPLLYSGRMFNSNSNWRISVMRPGDNPLHNLAEALVHPKQFDAALLNNHENENEKYDKTEVGIVETILRRSGVGLSDFTRTANLENKENLLVVVDQFEELFRFRHKMQIGYADEAAAFVKLLIEATLNAESKTYVVITMRSDFFGNCAEFIDLPEAINKGQYLVSRMNRNQLRESIESPAKVFDAEVSPALVNHLLNNLEENNEQSFESDKRNFQDQLPILQHALMRTWQEWERQKTPDSPISLEHYYEIGGMKSALSNHASKVYGDLNEKQKILTEKLFKCLTEKDEENRQIRRPTTIRQICAVAGVEPNDVYTVVESFRRNGRTFLMPQSSIPLTENSKIDISHESLIRNWNVLQDWIKEESIDAWSYRRLSEDAGKWSHQSKNSDFLLRGRVLKDTLIWWEEFSPNKAWVERYEILTNTEKRELILNRNDSKVNETENYQKLVSGKFDLAREFLDESKKYQIEEQHEDEKRRQNETKARYVKWLALVSSLLLISLVGITLFAVDTYNKRKSLEIEKKELSNKQEALEKENLSLSDEKKRALEAEKQYRKIIGDFGGYPEYTSLSEIPFRGTPPCKVDNTINDENIVLQNCEGVLGFNLELITERKGDDSYQTINVIGPSKEKYNLNIKELSLPKGSIIVGGAAQWWIKKFKDKSNVVGLILAIDIFENSDNKKQFIVVSKITDKNICITDLVGPVKSVERDYSEARELGDIALGKPCLLK